MLRIVLLGSASFLLAVGAYGIIMASGLQEPAQPDQSRPFPTPVAVPTSVTLNAAPATPDNSAPRGGAQGSATPAVEGAPVPALACGIGRGAFESAAALFTVCYPITGIAKTRGAVDPYPETFTWRSTTEDLFVGMSVVHNTSITSGATASLAGLCSTFQSAMGIAFRVEPLRVGTATVESCRGVGDAGEAGVDPAYAFVPLKDGRFLQVEIVRGDSGAKTQEDLDALLAGVEVQ